MTEAAADLPNRSFKRRCVLVCQYRSCTRSGATEVLEAFQAALPTEVLAAGSGCLGQCTSGPTVQVMPDATWYCQIKPSDVPAIVEQHLLHDRPVEKFLHPRLHPRFHEQNW